MSHLQQATVVFLLVQFSAFTDAQSLESGGKEFFFLEGKDISFTCNAANVDENYTIEWSQETVVMTNGSATVKMISETLRGSNLTSTITLYNSITLPQKQLFIACSLKKNGNPSKEITFDYYPTRLNDLPNVTVSTTAITVDYDENVTITCTARSGLPYPLDVTWIKNGAVLKHSKADANKKVIVHRYTIDKATGASGGDYMCRAFTVERNVLMQDNATVTLSVLPKLVGEKSKQMYEPVGNDVKMTCDIVGYPLRITWRKKTNQGTFRNFLHTNGGNRYKLEKNGKVLTIMNSQSEDATTYICRVIDQRNTSISQTMTLITKVHPHIKNARNSQKNVTLVPGNVTILRCDIIGVPPVCVSWGVYDRGSNKRRDVTTITGIKKPAKCQKTLELRNISALKDGQRLICTAQDKVTQSFFIVKMTKPRLTGEPSKEIKSKEGDDVSWKCDIDVKPLNIQWFVGDRLLTGSSKKYKISKSDPRQFTVTDVDKSDRGSFYCRAQNALLMIGVRQEIILRVHNPIDWVWPVIGTLIVLFLVSLIIGITTFRHRKKKREQEAQEATDARDAMELLETTTSNHEEGGGTTQLLTQ